MCLAQVLNDALDEDRPRLLILLYALAGLIAIGNGFISGFILAGFHIIAANARS
jgi:hypothetical protein